MGCRLELIPVRRTSEMTEGAQRSSGLEQDLGTWVEIGSKGCRKHWELNCVEAGFILTAMPQNDTPQAEGTAVP